MEKIIPSLVINLLFDCNLRCVYCPPHGENLSFSKKLCSTDTINKLLGIARSRQIEMVRITGGEPLLDPERLKKILEYSVQLEFKRFVLNTNGTNLSENLQWLLEYRNGIEIKVSLDTLDSKEYKHITKYNMHHNVINGIIKAKENGFNVVLNTVISKINRYSIFDVIEFCEKYNLSIKIFDMSDFGNSFPERWGKYYCPINDLIKELEGRYEKKNNERLLGGRGRPMYKFVTDKGNTVLVINHHDTGKAVFSKQCETCDLYPCVSGRLCITLRADGLVTPCRIHPSLGTNIDGKNENFIAKIFDEQLETFNKCHYA